jgi:hypothetical protein
LIYKEKGKRQRKEEERGARQKKQRVTKEKRITKPSQLKSFGRSRKGLAAPAY